MFLERYAPAVPAVFSAGFLGAVACGASSLAPIWAGFGAGTLVMLLLFATFDPLAA
jgi:hypothetical protein